MVKKKDQSSTKTSSGSKARTRQLSAATKAVDPALAALFDSSLVKETTKPAYGRSRVSSTSLRSSVPEQTKQIPDGAALPGSDVDSALEKPINAVHLSTGTNGEHEKTKTRKRRRRDEDDDIEGQYMQRLAREEAHEATKQALDQSSKRSKLDNDTEVDASSSATATADHEDPDLSATSPPPPHETTATDSAPSSLEQSTRTVFLGNVSTTAITSRPAYTLLLAHLSSHLPSLPPSTPPHKISSLRFRSTPYADSSLPKKAAFAKKDLMTATTQSTNAYAVYNTAVAAREAAKQLNGTVVLDRHLRVDGVAHPAATDHRRCVFVGNLRFVDDETAIRAAEDAQRGEPKARKPKSPADVEEGLWRQFGHAGPVESVRVVRDQTTRVGKGFAYVQFKVRSLHHPPSSASARLTLRANRRLTTAQDPNAVERALLYTARAFPPLLPRPLRVTRAKHIAKTAAHAGPPTKRAPPPRPAGASYAPKPSAQAQSLSGRAGKLLGRAGAAQLRRGGAKVGRQGGAEGGAQAEPPGRVVFEGYRARGGQKPTGLQPKKGKGKGKPVTRSSRRGAAFKAEGGKRRKSG
ncbi:Nucleolar protein 12 [Xylographa vitiligo]|nr:Nucleolar protein 12 [Xylographa vitiligo]